MEICADWQGSYSNGENFLNISCRKSQDSEMLIILSSNGGPPSLVVRVDSSMSPWPFKKTFDPSFHHVHSDHSFELKDLILQKVEVVNSSAPDNKNNWKVTVSEFKVEVDYFHEIAPDDERKCVRKFVFTTFAENKLKVDCWDKVEQKTKNTVFEKITHSTEFDNLFDTFEDRRVGEAKAMVIFKMYNEEKWMINDGILENALVEEEAKYGLEKNSTREEVQTMVTPGGGCQEDHVDSTEDETIDDDLITEDSLWERDVFEENQVCSNDYN